MTPATMDSDRKTRLGLATLSILAGLIILGLKWWAYFLTGSVALQSDALEGLVNVVAAFFALGAIVYAEKPADRDHPYGHGKIEFFSAAFEGGLISLASAMIAYESVRGLIRGTEITDLSLGLVINLLAGAGNGILGLYLRKRGRELGSEAIEADGIHILSDFYTTLGLAVGLGLMWVTGWIWLDSVLGLGVAAVLAVAGFKLVRKASQALLDAEDPETIRALTQAMNEARRPDIVAVHELRALRSGRLRHVSVHVAVPETYSVREGHDAAASFLREVIRKVGFKGEVQFHVDPCGKSFCARCGVKDCEIRELPLVRVEPFTENSVVDRGPPELDDFDHH